MDLFVDSYKDNRQQPIRDFVVTSKGQLKTVSGENAIQQRAIISAFTQKGTIPQLPNTGVEWAELLTGDITPSEINSQILKSIHECANSYAYIPRYSAVNDELVVTISKGA